MSGKELEIATLPKVKSFEIQLWIFMLNLDGNSLEESTRLKGFVLFLRDFANILLQSTVLIWIEAFLLKLLASLFKPRSLIISWKLIYIVKF